MLRSSGSEVDIFFSDRIHGRGDSKPDVCRRSEVYGYYDLPKHCLVGSSPDCGFSGYVVADSRAECTRRVHCHDIDDTVEYFNRKFTQEVSGNGCL